MKKARSRATLCAAGLMGLLAAARTAQAQANLSFSGAEGVDFTINLAAPITYTINADYGIEGPTHAPAFVFKAVGDDFSFAGSAAAGTVTFTDDGGPQDPIEGAYSGQTVASLSPNDLYLWGPEDGVSVGDVITLSAGTLSTHGGPLPANGSYITYIMDGNGNDISTNGVVSVPEPASVGLMLVGTMALSARRRKRGIMHSGSGR